MRNCPMTGNPCSFEKVFSISETVGEFTYTTACCRNCAKEYIDLRNQSAVQQTIQTEQAAPDATSLISQLLGIDLTKLSQPITIHKLGIVKSIPEIQAIHPAKICPGCNYTLGDIRKLKKLGC